jgi:amino acid adenylation domain-containing protein
MDSIESLLQLAVPARFEEAASCYAGRVALKRSESSLTYETLDRAANRLAHALLNELGEGQEPVALLVDQGLAAVLGILGILKAGKFYVPLDKGHPPARLVTILEDSGASLVLADNRNFPLAERLVSGGSRRMNLEALDPALPEHSPNLTLTPDAFLNIMYTSGSTGKPKGALQIQRNLLHAVYAGFEYSPRSAEDRFLLLTSYSFGASAAMIFSTLLTGGLLVIANLKEDGIDRLPDMLVQEEITHFHSVPTVFRHLLGSMKPGQKIPSVQHIALGGEAVYRKDFEAFKGHFSEGCKLRVGLGTTENYLATHFMMDHGSEISSPVVPVGYPVHGVKVSILDPNGKPLPPGETGQIAIQSRFLAPGYWRLPELTRSVYLPDPSGGEERIHLTGDLGKLSADGCLEHLGRMDLLLKVRGHRVEPVEVEAAILEQPGIRETVVVGLEKQPGEMSLVAYFIPENGSAVSISTLRANLREKLPEYMIPTHFVPLERFPMLPFGKIDLRALPLPEEDRVEKRPALSGLRLPFEQSVALIFGEVLDKEMSDPDQSFFELGGNSLSAAQVVIRIREELGVEMSITDLVEAPTAGELAARIGRQKERNLGQAVNPPDDETLRRALDLLEKF